MLTVVLGDLFKGIYIMKSSLNSCKKVFVYAIALGTILLSKSVSANEDKPGEGIIVKPIFPPIIEERFRGEIAIAGLKELGYTVEEPKESEYPTMFLALSYGDADFTAHLWNSLHENFYQKAGGNSTMVKLGTIMSNVHQGYLIDKKTADKYQIDSLDDFKDPKIAKLFDSNGDGKADLTGCTPGWGCELVIDHHIKAYGLDKTVTHNRGSYFALMADTISRYNEGYPIFYYTWVPQWISGVLKEGQDVTWLSVPYTSLPDGKNDINTSYNGKNLGFAVDDVMIVANRDFAEANPVAAKFLSQVHISISDESKENMEIRDGQSSINDIKNHAQEWINHHRKEYENWINTAKSIKY